MGRDFRFLPLEGLLSIRKEDISGVDVFAAIAFAEEKIASLPKGRVSGLASLFLLINLIGQTGLPFYPKGGLIQHYRLKEKARPTYDLDIITPIEGGMFLQKIKEVLPKDGSLSLLVKEEGEIKANHRFYYDSFSMALEIIHEGQSFATVHLDGASNPFLFEAIQPRSYPIPEIIPGKKSFKGAPIEYVLAEKIIAITNELPRPYKHLIDVYSIIQTKVDVPLLKEYLSKIIESDDRQRLRLGKEIHGYQFRIKDDKRFVSNYIMPMIQAGYNIPFEDVRNEVNQWLAENLS